MKPFDLPSTGGADARRRHEARAMLLLAVLVVPLARGLARTAAPADEYDARVPIAIDLARDPTWRLTLLPGVGRRRAQDIVDDRELRGPPPTLDALQRVRAIGPGTVSRLRHARSVRVLLAGRPVGLPP